MNKPLENFVRTAHKGQKRAGGGEYYFHLLNVANIAKKYADGGIKQKAYNVGLCHDYLEDVKGAIFKDLIKPMGSLAEVNACILLNKNESNGFDQYINRISKNKLASIVKLADRLDNISTKHPDWDNEKIFKYLYQAEVMANKLGRHCPELAEELLKQIEIIKININEKV